MGHFLDKPKTKHEKHECEGNGLQAGLAAMQGWRVEMEVSTHYCRPRGSERAAAAQPPAGGRAASARALRTAAAATAAAA